MEWTFYLVAPVVLFLMRRRGVGAGTGRTGLLAAAGTLYVLGLTLDELSFYLLPVANLGVLVAGAALALSHIDRDERGVAGTKDPAYARMAAVMLGILVILPGDSLSWGWKLSVVPAATVTLRTVCWLWSRVIVAPPGTSMTTSSVAVGTRLRLQLAALVHEPLAPPVQRIWSPGAGRFSPGPLSGGPPGLACPSYMAYSPRPPTVARIFPRPPIERTSCPLS